MDTRKNRREHKENFVTGQHLKLTDLKERAQHGNNYIFKEIPAYPRPEFHVSHLKHDTNQKGIRGIRKDMGFCAPNQENLDLVWWSLAVGPQEIDSAEKRLLEETYPARREEQAQEQKSFLGKFATSPAFLKSSRFGSYRFTFPLQEVLEAYREQFCRGSDPVLRVHKTVLYKQEVMYSVLVHSDVNNKLFEEYPLLTDGPDAVCAYKDGHFIWRSEAMCETHRFQLVQDPDQNQLVAQPVNTWAQFYVWDNVAVAFHVPDHQMLFRFDEKRLRECLNFCEPGKPMISTFEPFQEAEKIVQDLWPNYELPLSN